MHSVLRLHGLEFTVGLRLQGFGFRVQGLGFKVCATNRSLS